MPSVTILATVNEIKDFSFCYPFCNVCQCKTQIFPLDANRRKCNRNGHMQLDSETQYCYRLHLEISDGEQICPVTVFGDSVAEIFGDTATNIKGYISHLENSLQGLDISILDLIRQAMIMVICRRMFSFVFNLPTNATNTGRDIATLSLIRSKFGSGAIAQNMLVTPPSVDVFTVYRGIKLLVKKFLSNSCNNSQSFNFSLLDKDSSRLSEPYLDARSMSFRSAEVSKLFDDDSLEVATWEIPSTNESGLTFPTIYDNNIVSPSLCQNTDTSPQDSSTEANTVAASSKSYGVTNAGPNRLEKLSPAASQKVIMKNSECESCSFQPKVADSDKLKIVHELTKDEKNFNETLQNLQILKLGHRSCPELTSTPKARRH